MATERADPYAAFNYQVTIIPQFGGTISAGFAEVSGLETEVTYAEYREGTASTAAVSKIPLQYKVGDVTLKRGLAGRLDLWQWIEQVRRGNPQARATVSIELREEANQDVVARWNLHRARPSKWTGPSLAAKGASDVAMEEMVLVCEDITYE